MISTVGWWAANGRGFSCGSAMHAAVIAVTVVAVVAIVVAGRLIRRRGATVARRLDRCGAAVLLLTWATVVAYDLKPARRSVAQSTPLQVCDVVIVSATIGLFTRRRTARAIGYFWGLGLSSLAFIAPVLREGPNRPAFWLYWGLHGGIMAAAAYDVFARRYRPRWADWRLAVAAASAYAPAVVVLNAMLETNFGYLGAVRGGRQRMVDAFGPWPGRVPWIVLTGCGVMAALALPWPRNRRAGHQAGTNRSSITSAGQNTRTGAVLKPSPRLTTSHVWRTRLTPARNRHG